MAPPMASCLLFRTNGLVARFLTLFNFRRCLPIARFTIYRLIWTVSAPPPQKSISFNMFFICSTSLLSLGFLLLFCLKASCRCFDSFVDLLTPYGTAYNRNLHSSAWNRANKANNIIKARF